MEEGSVLLSSLWSLENEVPGWDEIRLNLPRFVPFGQPRIISERCATTAPHCIRNRGQRSELKGGQCTRRIETSQVAGRWFAGDDSLSSRDILNGNRNCDKWILDEGYFIPMKDICRVQAWPSFSTFRLSTGWKDLEIFISRYFISYVEFWDKKIRIKKYTVINHTSDFIYFKRINKLCYQKQFLFDMKHNDENRMNFQTKF